MQRYGLNLNWFPSILASFLMLATGAGPARAGQPGKGDPPKLLLEKIVTAWQAAGAEVGWMRQRSDGSHWFVLEKAGEPGDLPAFRFSPKAKEIPKLPDPVLAFGLGLAYSQVTDAELKELAGLNSFQSLSMTSKGI